MLILGWNRCCFFFSQFSCWESKMIRLIKVLSFSQNLDFSWTWKLQWHCFFFRYYYLSAIGFMGTAWIQPHFIVVMVYACVLSLTSVVGQQVRLTWTVFPLSALLLMLSLTSSYLLYLLKFMCRALKYEQIPTFLAS